MSFFFCGTGAAGNFYTVEGYEPNPKWDSFKLKIFSNLLLDPWRIEMCLTYLFWLTPLNGLDYFHGSNTTLTQSSSFSLKIL